MRERIRSHLTYANVISSVCLFLLLGGGTAVALNGANSVQSDDIGPGAQVKAADVADNAINSADIQNGQVSVRDTNKVIPSGRRSAARSGKLSTAEARGRSLTSASTSMVSAHRRRLRTPTSTSTTPASPPPQQAPAMRAAAAPAGSGSRRHRPARSASTCSTGGSPTGALSQRRLAIKRGSTRQTTRASR